MNILQGWALFCTSLISRTTSLKSRHDSLVLWAWQSYNLHTPQFSYASYHEITSLWSSSKRPLYSSVRMASPVTECSPQHDKSFFFFIFWSHFYQVIPWEAIHEGIYRTIYNIVDQDIYMWQRKAIFGASIV